jgi:hypothetical protein
MTSCHPKAASRKLRRSNSCSALAPPRSRAGDRRPAVRREGGGSNLRLVRTPSSSNLAVR